MKHEHYDLILAYINGEEVEYSAITNPMDLGWLPIENICAFDYTGCRFRLKLKTTQHRGWVNIYKNQVAPTQYEADARAQPGRVACIPVEWEE